MQRVRRAVWVNVSAAFRQVCRSTFLLASIVILCPPCSIHSPRPLPPLVPFCRCVGLRLPSFSSVPFTRCDIALIEQKHVERSDISGRIREKLGVCVTGSLCLEQGVCWE